MVHFGKKHPITKLKILSYVLLTYFWANFGRIQKLWRCVLLTTATTKHYELILICAFDWFLLHTVARVPMLMGIVFKTLFFSETELK